MVHSIQFLRFVAAFLVVLHHSVILLPSEYSFAQSVVHVTSAGEAGVHVFFIISGFVITHVNFTIFGETRKIATYFTRRFARIFPIYWLLSLIGAVAFLLLGLRQNYDLTDSFLSLLLIPPFSSYLIFVGWTLSFEIFFYVCFGFVLPMRRSAALIVLTFTLGILIASGRVFQIEGEIPHVLTNALLVEFIVGVWLAVFFNSKASIDFRLGAFSVAISIVLFSLGAVARPPAFPAVAVWGVPAVFLVAGFIVMEKQPGFGEKLQKLSWLGDSSYSLYLVHALWMPVSIYLIGRTFLESDQRLAFVLFQIVTSVLAGFASYRFLEVPIISYARSLMRLSRGK